MIDYWQDYKPSNDGKMPSIPSMRSIDAKRIRAYCEAIGVDRYKQPINAKFMNEMEDWYLDLAEHQGKVGHWIYMGQSEMTGLKICKCSECHKRTYGSQRYCPNCGRKMRKCE